MRQETKSVAGSPTAHSTVETYEGRWREGAALILKASIFIRTGEPITMIIRNAEIWGKPYALVAHVRFE